MPASPSDASFDSLLGAERNPRFTEPRTVLAAVFGSLRVVHGETDAAGLNTPGAVVTSPLVHSGGGDWDIGPNISMDGAYGLVVQWAFVCKFNTSPMLAMEIYGGSLANPVIVKAGSGCVLTKLG